MRQFVLAPVVVVLASLASTGHAAVTLKLDGYALTNSLGAITSIGSGPANSASNAANSRTMGWQVNSIGTTVIQDIAGQFGGTKVEAGLTKPFAAYCTELNQGFNPFPTGSLTYDVVNGATYFSATVYDRVGRLYSENIVFDTAEKNAAFQIALWETIYETTTTLAVGDGNLAGSADFRTVAGGTATAATFALAQTYLNNIATTTFDKSKVAIVVYTNPTSQDLIVAIPESSTYMMMFGGLLAIGALGAYRARGQR